MAAKKPKKLKFDTTFSFGALAKPKKAKGSKKSAGGKSSGAWAAYTGSKR